MQAGLQALFNAGRFNKIIELEKVVCQRHGLAGESSDEGEPIRDICDSLAVVYKALGKCILADRLLNRLQGVQPVKRESSF